MKNNKIIWEVTFLFTSVFDLGGVFKSARYREYRVRKNLGEFSSFLPTKDMSIPIFDNDGTLKCHLPILKVTNLIQPNGDIISEVIADGVRATNIDCSGPDHEPDSLKALREWGYEVKLLGDKTEKI